MFLTDWKKLSVKATRLIKTISGARVTLIMHVQWWQKEAAEHLFETDYLLYATKKMQYADLPLHRIYVNKRVTELTAPKWSTPPAVTCFYSH